MSRPRLVEPAPRPEEDLTDRQLEVARLVSDGLTDKQIAGALGISEHTVAFHIRRIMVRWQLTPARNVRVLITRKLIAA